MTTGDRWRGERASKRARVSAGAEAGQHGSRRWRPAAGAGRRNACGAPRLSSSPSSPSSHRRCDGEQTSEEADSVGTDATSDGSARRLSAHRGSRPLSKLQQRLESRLDSSSFRVLNEMLYTSTSAHAVAVLRNEPSLFDAYHRGYREQMAQWPRKPVDACLQYLRDRVEARMKRQRRQHVLARGAQSSFCASAATAAAKFVVADLGCGEARIAQALARDSRVVVHSYDLLALNARVTACDVARGVPLASGAADVVVFCLSLMGSNYEACIREGVRLLTPPAPGGSDGDDDGYGAFVGAEAEGGEVRRRGDRRDSGVGERRMIVVEVTSRFAAGGGTTATAADAAVATATASSSTSRHGDANTERAFIRGIEARGMRLLRREAFTDYFVFFEFAAATPPPPPHRLRSRRRPAGGGGGGGGGSGAEPRRSVDRGTSRRCARQTALPPLPPLKPCVYKKR